MVRKRGGRKRALGTRTPMAIPQSANQRWSLDFVSDALTTSRKFRILAIVDDFSRECLALVVDNSLSGARVARELSRIVEIRGTPCMIVSDNGTELTSHAMFVWQEEHGIEWHYIAPGKPTDNAFIEAFNGRFRAECLNAHWFMTLKTPGKNEGFAQVLQRGSPTRRDRPESSDSAARSRWLSQPATVRQGRKIYLPAIQSLGSAHRFSPPVCR